MWTADKIIYRGDDSFVRAYSGSTLVWSKGPISLLQLIEDGGNYTDWRGNPMYLIPADVTVINPDTYDWTGIVNIMARNEVGYWGSVNKAPTVSFGTSPDLSNTNVIYATHIDISIPDTQSIIYFIGEKGENCHTEYIRLRNTDKVYSMQKAFYQSPSLKTVILGNLSGATYGGEQQEFAQCPLLEDVQVERWPLRQLNNIGFATCPSLTVDSLVNILTALPDGGGRNYSIQLGQTNIDKLTDEQKAIATDKGWNITA